MIGDEIGCGGRSEQGVGKGEHTQPSGPGHAHSPLAACMGGGRFRLRLDPSLRQAATKLLANALGLAGPVVCVARGNRA